MHSFDKCLLSSFCMSGCQELLWSLEIHQGAQETKILSWKLHTRDADNKQGKHIWEVDKCEWRKVKKDEENGERVYILGRGAGEGLVQKVHSIKSLKVLKG